MLHLSSANAHHRNKENSLFFRGLYRRGENHIRWAGMSNVMILPKIWDWKQTFTDCFYCCFGEGEGLIKRKEPQYFSWHIQSNYHECIWDEKQISTDIHLNFMLEKKIKCTLRNSRWAWGDSQKYRLIERGGVKKKKNSLHIQIIVFEDCPGTCTLSDLVYWTRQ